MSSIFKSDDVFYCTYFLGIFIIWAVAAVVTALMMNKRGENGIVWGLIVFLLQLVGVLVLFIYIATTNEKSGSKRDNYTSTTGVYGGNRGVPQAPTKKVEANSYFRDYELDDLLAEGRLGEARKYLKDMLQMAKEMGDQQGYENFKSYEAKINKIATDPMQGGRRNRDY